MTTGANQSGDAEPSRTPGLNSSVKTSMNDHGICYYLCHYESASVIPYRRYIALDRRWYGVKH